MFPTNKRFKADNLARFKIDQGLVEGDGRT
jgi:hypothetical protein